MSHSKGLNKRLLNWQGLLLFQNCRIPVSHVESRKSKKSGNETEFLVQFEANRESLIGLVKTLKQSSAITDVTVLGEKDINKKGNYSFFAFLMSLSYAIYCLRIKL